LNRISFVAMIALQSKEKKADETYLIAFLILASILVHLINLGLMPLHGDEGIRATVSLEMILSGNYIQPSTWSEPYYYKTPLYNWILSGFMILFGYSEFVFRLPSVLSLFLLSWITYNVSKDHLGKRLAFYASLALMFSGRLLTRDSMLGHIDLFYSVVSFLQIYSIYSFYQKKNFTKLFLVSYFLMSAGFLMKGLPSLAFQGITLLTWFGIKRELKSLFSLKHLSGLLIAGIILGSYFYFYSISGEEELYLERLYRQSAERSPLDHSFTAVLKQLFTFAFENVAHLFPSSVFFLFVIQKELRKKISSEPFILFIAIAFIANLIPYWLSPGYYPRYLFMLYPMPFIISFYLLKTSGIKAWLSRFLNAFWLVMAFIFVIALCLSAFYFDLQKINSYGIILGSLILICLSLIVFKLRHYLSLLAFSFSLLILFRLCFDLLIIPYRVNVEVGERVQQKTHAMKISALTGDAELLVWPYTPLTENYAYYLGSQKNQIIKKSYDYESGQFFLMPEAVSKELSLEAIYRFDSGFEDIQVVLVRFP
jgi:4-amino-4-deoxy-L-arabinose transferase-like glycosyltransferase